MVNSLSLCGLFRREWHGSCQETNQSVWRWGSWTYNKRTKDEDVAKSNVTALRLHEYDSWGKPKPLQWLHKNLWQEIVTFRFQEECVRNIVGRNDFFFYTIQKFHGSFLITSWLTICMFAPLFWVEFVSILSWQIVNILESIQSFWYLN